MSQSAAPPCTFDGSDPKIFAPSPRVASKSPVIIVAGSVCAGKGTQCKRLASRTGLVHVSVGDLCRAYAQENSELGLAIKGYMERGEFVPDDVMLKVVGLRLALPDVVQQGVVLDGFPRTRKQAEEFLVNTSVDAFILLQVSDDTVKARAAGRLLDPKSGEIYHLEFKPPPEKLASKLTYREGDRDQEAVSKRLEIYHQSSETIISLFEGKAEVVNGDLSPDAVFECISRAVEKFVGISITPAAAQEEQEEEDDWSDDETPAQDTVSQVHVAIAPAQDMGFEGGDHKIAVSLHAPEQMSDPANKTAGRVPSDVCCVIDISGSMRTEATYEDENENVKSDGLTYLDIVKHAVKTVIHMLGAHDRLALVAFDSTAEVIFPADYMTNEGRSRAVTELEALQPRGRTNIWKGLHAGLEALHSADKDGWRPKTVLLLTDGVPNEVPPEGHIKVLRDYKESHPDFSFMINTFGFGYQLDSALLLNLAVEGQGTYGFIPDALLVGTCFVDSVANLLSTQTQSATVHLKAMSGAQFSGSLPGVDAQMVTDTSWGRVVDIGPLQFGGTRELVVPLHIPAGDESQADRPYLEAVVVYTGADGKEQQASGKGSSRKATQSAVAALARSSTVSVGYQAVDLAATNASKNEEAQQTMKDHVDTVRDLEATGGDWVQTLKGDIEGRVSKALLGDKRFHRWGKHYLRAFTRAHQIQFCTNFMDKSLQDYGGNLFRALRSEGDSIFVSLPPPQPAPKPVVLSSQRRASAPAATSAPAAQPDMTVYYGGGGGG